MKKNKKGFTLIELLAVLIITGVILVIALQSYKTLQGNNIDNKFKKYIELVKDATDLTIEGKKDEWDSNECRTVPYTDLLLNDLIKEDDVTCVGNVYVRKTGKLFEYDTSQLECTDKDGNEYKDKDNSIPFFTDKNAYATQCGGSKFNAATKISNVKTNSFTAKGYCSYTGFTITKYEYTITDQDGNSETNTGNYSDNIEHEFTGLKANTKYDLTLVCTADNNEKQIATTNATTLKFSSANDPKIIVTPDNDGWNSSAQADITFNNTGISEPSSYIMSDVSAESDANLTKCDGDYDKGFNCNGEETNKIEKGVWYYSSKKNVKLKYESAISDNAQTVKAITCTGNCTLGHSNITSKRLPKIDITAPEGSITYSINGKKITINAKGIKDAESGINNYIYKVRSLSNPDTFIKNEESKDSTYTFDAEYGQTYTVYVEAYNNAGLSKGFNIAQITLKSGAQISLREDRTYHVGYYENWAIGSKVTATLLSDDQNENFYFRLNDENAQDQTTNLQLDKSNVTIYDCGDNSANYINSCNTKAENIIASHIYKMQIEGFEANVSTNVIFNINNAKSIGISVWTVATDKKINISVIKVDNSSYIKITPLSTLPKVGDVTTLTYEKGNVESRLLNGGVFEPFFQGIAPSHFWCSYADETGTSKDIENVNELSNKSGTTRVWCKYVAANGHGTKGNDFIDVVVKPIYKTYAIAGTAIYYDVTKNEVCTETEFIQNKGLINGCLKFYTTGIDSEERSTIDLIAWQNVWVGYYGSQNSSQSYVYEGNSDDIKDLGNDRYICKYRIADVWASSWESSYTTNTSLKRYNEKGQEDKNGEWSECTKWKLKQKKECNALKTNGCGPYNLFDGLEMLKAKGWTTSVPTESPYYSVKMPTGHYADEKNAIVYFEATYEGLPARLLTLDEAVQIMHCDPRTSTCEYSEYTGEKGYEEFVDYAWLIPNIKKVLSNLYGQNLSGSYPWHGIWLLDSAEGSSNAGWTDHFNTAYTIGGYSNGGPHIAFKSDIKAKKNESTASASYGLRPVISVDKSKLTYLFQ